jgi:hypothetical protein
MSATPQPSASPIPVAVNITYVPGAPPRVDADPIVIDRTQGGNNVEIVWLCSQTFYICFPNDSPFQQRHYGSLDNHSGPILPGASGTYKYTVEIDGQILDPQVIIRP